MKLKRYQKKTLDTLQSYIIQMRNYPVDKAAGVAFMIMRSEAQDRFPKDYHWLSEIGKSPFVCIKVPTGGGKTFIAVYALGIICRDYLGARNDKGLIMWFVPSDAIKEQTLNNLRNRNHPYREALDKRFKNAIKVFDLSEARSIRKDDLGDNLCIVVATLSAFRRTDKEWLKAYQDNGDLMGHFEELDSKGLDFLDRNKEGEFVYSLVNVIKLHNPLVIVDEGHNVQTELSYEMLKNINPSFVLEFTATPRGKSNVLVDISAAELKEEKMIKMPVYLANKVPWQDTIYSGIAKLKELQRRAKENKGEYIRPIMLIQAEQEKDSPKKVFVGQIRKFLIEEVKIPENETAVQTAKNKELPRMEELLGKSCSIKYVITVNALREGWDCPFAYVLVSVSNLGAYLSVEQTIGRIMRLPYAKEKSDSTLNSAYIFAATKNFNQASQVVIDGLHANGYEDIIPLAGGVSLAEGVFKRKIRDNKIALPYINIKEDQAFRRLDYTGDLIGNEDVLARQRQEVELKLIEDSMVAKVDIGKEGELVRDAAGKLALRYHHKDFTREDLLLWFKEKIQRGFISMQDMGRYLERVVGFLLTKYSLDKISMGRYQVKDTIERKIDSILDAVTEKKFNALVKRRVIAAKGECFNFGPNFVLMNPCRDNFSKHLYEKAAKMNKEEIDLAYQLNGLSSVFWWFRNPDKNGFYIQGWFKGKFYPDFIVKTKRGTCFILEYKGEHLVGTEDTTYKEALGKKWQQLAGKNYYFEIISKANLISTIEKISKS